MPLEFEDLTERIIAAAIAVHRALGPGFVESIYENAFCIELQNRGIPFERQLKIRIRYQGIEVGWHRLDLLIARCIVVELKAVSRLDDIHFVFVRSYLRSIDQNLGLILNFAGVTLQVRRVGLSTFTDRTDPH